MRMGNLDIENPCFWLRWQVYRPSLSSAVPGAGLRSGVHGNDQCQGTLMAVNG